MTPHASTVPQEIVPCYDRKDERFNMLVVQYTFLVYHEKRQRNLKYAACLCDCGSLCTARLDALQNGDKKSCGCASNALRQESLVKHKAGNTYGKLTILERFVEKTETAKTHKVRCQCICGNTCIYPLSLVVSSTGLTCGCFRSNRKDLTDKTFGLLTVTATTWEKSIRMVEALCQCGRTWRGTANNIVRAPMPTCGCRWEEMTHRSEAFKRDRHRIIAARRRARIKGLPDTFTREAYDFMMRYFAYACVVCGRQEGFEWMISADHWIPIAAADCPGTIATNMTPLCLGLGGCNNSKRHHDPLPWLTRRYGPRKARQIVRTVEAYFAVVREREQIACQGP